MSTLRIVSHGIAVTTAVVPDGPAEPLALSVQGNTTTVNVENIALRGADPRIILSITIPADGEKRQGTVAVPFIVMPHARRRGWSVIESSLEQVRAFAIHEEEGDTVVLFHTPNTKDFMAQIPDDASLADVTLPGTHESCALYGFYISQCQQVATPIDQQLNDGVRFLDVRLKVIGDQLETYHGIRPERSTLRRELDVINTFLTQHPRETVVVSIKEEDIPGNPVFPQMVYEHFMTRPDLWVFDERVPRLGDVRGKGIIMPRFERSSDDQWPKGMGLKPWTWPDSRPEGFEWDCHGTPVRTIDWYRVESFLDIPEKTAGVIKFIEPTLAPKNPQPLTIAFSSASAFPLAPPQWIAKGVGFPSWGLGVNGVNQRLTKWLLQQMAAGRRPRCVIMADFYHQAGDRDASLAELLVASNFI